MTNQEESQDSVDALTLGEARNDIVGDKDGSNTVRTYKTGTDHFLRWCESEGLAETSDLRPTTVRGFNAWVKDKVASVDWKPRTARTYSGAAREFVHHCEKLLVGVPYGTHDHIDRHGVGDKEKKADLPITPERASEVVDWYKEHHPHSRATVIVWILSDTGMRAGAGLRGIDVGDLGVRDGTPFIHLVHRPELGDPMKKESHQRKVPITEGLYREIKKYVEHKRLPCEERSGRRPLLTTDYNGEYRRISDRTIQNTVYKATCPETTGITTDVGDCSCDRAPSTKTASKCEHSVSPHKFRGAACVRMKDAGFDYEEQEPYLGATGEVLRSVYDKADEDRRMDRAEGLLEALD